MSTETAAS